MGQDKFYMLIGFATIVIGAVIAFWIMKKFSDKVNIFLRDTMKEKQSDGTWKWSKTALTMASAWYAVLYSFFFDLVKNGFNETAFMVMVAVALGMPVTSAYAKKVNPLIQPPKEDEKV